MIDLLAYAAALVAVEQRVTKAETVAKEKLLTEEQVIFFMGKALRIAGRDLSSYPITDEERAKLRGIFDEWK